MADESELPDGEIDFDDATNALNAIGLAATAAKKLGVSNRFSEELGSKVAKAKGVAKVATSAAAAGATVAGATGLAVAATSGAGIASGLAAAGGVVGAGMAAGPAALAGGPAYLASQGLNSTVFKKEEGLSPEESSARSAARVATNVGAAAGVFGTGAAVVAGGTSGAAIMSTLVTVGGVVGGGAIAGTAVLVAAPVAIAAAAGFGVYRLLGGGKKTVPTPPSRSK